MLRHIYILIVILGLAAMHANAQVLPQPPQRTATVTATQSLEFGDLTILPGSAGGTVSVDYTGSRSASGSVILLNLGSAVRPAIFEYKLCPGRLVAVSYPASVTLNGSAGGTLTLNIGPTSVGVSGDTFVSNKGCDEIHQIAVGGTLLVGSMAANPRGYYTGTFQLTFIQQ